MSQEHQKNRIINKNERALRKRKKLRLRKIKTIGLHAAGLVMGIASTVFIADTILPQETLTNPRKINLEFDEESLRADLNDYYNAREDYKEGNISTPEFVSEARKLSDAALDFMKEEIKDTVNADETDQVYIERTTVTADGPTDTITIVDKDGDIKQVYDELPDEIAGTFNGIVEMQNWNGDGENWTDKEGKKFMHRADAVYEGLSYIGEIEGNLDLDKPIIDNTETEVKTK